MLTFIELHPFAIARDKYLTDDEFAALQHYLVTRPHAGDIIPLGRMPEAEMGSRGARKAGRSAGNLFSASGAWSDRAGHDVCQERPG